MILIFIFGGAIIPDDFSPGSRIDASGAMAKHAPQAAHDEMKFLLDVAAGL